MAKKNGNSNRNGETWMRMTPAQRCYVEQVVLQGKASMNAAWECCNVKDKRNAIQRAYEMRNSATVQKAMKELKKEEWDRVGNALNLLSQKSIAVANEILSLPNKNPQIVSAKQRLVRDILDRAGHGPTQETKNTNTLIGMDLNKLHELHKKAKESGGEEGSGE